MVKCLFLSNRMASEKRLTRSQVRELDKAGIPRKKAKTSQERKRHFYECGNDSRQLFADSHNTSSSSGGRRTLEEQNQAERDAEHCKVNPTSSSDTEKISKSTHGKEQLLENMNEVGTANDDKKSIQNKNRGAKNKRYKANEDIVETNQRHKRNVSSLYNNDNQETVYKINCIDKANIKVEAHGSNSNTTDVWSMCLLASGNVLLADHAITSLLMLDRLTYKVRPVLALQAKPNSVCNVSNEEIVIALSNDSLQFVSVQGEEFALIRSLQFNHLCLGVAVAYGQIYVTDGRDGHLYIYRLDGTIVKQIKEDSFGNSIFTWNRFIGICDGGDRIHVTDCEKCVVIFDKDGNVIRKCSLSGIKGSYGICTDGKDNMFVTGLNSKNVKLVTKDGVDQGEIVPSKHCLEKPKGVCFDQLNLKLYVCGETDYDIRIYTLDRLA